MRESEIEKNFKAMIKDLGGVSYKWVSPGLRGVPDQMCLMPFGHCFFAEIKQEGKEATPIQLRRHAELKAAGFPVFVVDSQAHIDGVKRWWKMLSDKGFGE